MSIPDTIEKRIVIDAPLERVWQAITRPEQIAQWFGDIVEFEALREGEPIRFGWTEFDDTNIRGIIHKVEAPHEFAFYWESSGSDPDAPLMQTNHTLVQYMLSEVPEGTELQVLESGFASLPADVRQGIREENAGGWQAELNDLIEYLAADESV